MDEMGPAQRCSVALALVDQPWFPRPRLKKGFEEVSKQTVAALGTRKPDIWGTGTADVRQVG
jgi:hypothetical protein